MKFETSAIAAAIFATSTISAVAAKECSTAILNGWMGDKCTGDPAMSDLPITTDGTCVTLKVGGFDASGLIDLNTDGTFDAKVWLGKGCGGASHGAPLAHVPVVHENTCISQKAGFFTLAITLECGVTPPTTGKATIASHSPTPSSSSLPSSSATPSSSPVPSASSTPSVSAAPTSSPSASAAIIATSTTATTAATLVGASATPTPSAVPSTSPSTSTNPSTTPSASKMGPSATPTPSVTPSASTSVATPTTTTTSTFAAQTTTSTVAVASTSAIVAPVQSVVVQAVITPQTIATETVESFVTTCAERFPGDTSSTQACCRWGDNKCVGLTKCNLRKCIAGEAHNTIATTQQTVQRTQNERVCGDMFDDSDIEVNKPCCRWGHGACAHLTKCTRSLCKESRQRDHAGIARGHTSTANNKNQITCAIKKSLDVGSLQCDVYETKQCCRHSGDCGDLAKCQTKNCCRN